MPISRDTPQATILIATRNRRDRLKEALLSTLEQTAAIEVIVVDGASSDGTPQLLAEEFPEVRVHRNERARGCAPERNEGIEMSRAPIVLVLDDDAHFSTPHTVEQTLGDFDHPRVGAVAIPMVNVLTDASLRYSPPAQDGVYVTPTYSGGACAVRRDVFLGLGGYRGYFVEQVEEGDYALRMLDAGYVTRLGRSDPIIHREVRAGQDLSERFFFIGRNEILHAWGAVPLPYTGGRLLKSTVKAQLHGFRSGRPWDAFRGIVKGYRDLLVEHHARKPVTRSTYRLSRELRDRPMALDEIEARLPAVAG